MPDQQQLHMYSIAVIIVPFNLRYLNNKAQLYLQMGYS